MLNHIRKKIGHSTYTIVRSDYGIGFVIVEMYQSNQEILHGVSRKRFYTIDEAVEELTNIRNERVIIGDGYPF